MEDGTFNSLIGWIIVLLFLSFIIFYVISKRADAPDPMSNDTINKVVGNGGADPNNVVYPMLLLPFGAIFKYSRGKKSITRGGL